VVDLEILGYLVDSGLEKTVALVQPNSVTARNDLELEVVGPDLHYKANCTAYFQGQ